MWTCPKCESKVDPSFEVCWNCGTSPTGVVDPNFVTADEAGPIDGPSLVPELNIDNIDYPVDVELPHPIRGELVEAYRAYDLVEVQFLRDQLIDAGIPAVSDNLDLVHQSISGVDSGPIVWVVADDLPRARLWLEEYERNKATPVQD